MMDDDDTKRYFINCEKCGKRLIERLPNGLFRFKFGRRTDAQGKDLNDPPVEIIIHGNIVIKCLKASCGHMNELTFLPNMRRLAHKQSVPAEPSSVSELSNPAKED